MINNDTPLNADLFTLPPEWIEILIAVGNMGAEKHGADSWKNENNPSLETEANRASIGRHDKKLRENDYLDHESGLDHAGHIAWRYLADYSRRLAEESKGNK